MKKLMLSLAALVTAATASANEGAKVGVGAAIGLDRTTVISVPLNVMPRLRLEPFVGYTRTKTTDATDPAGDVVTTDSKFELGIGAYYVVAPVQQVELYCGGKLELTTAKNKTKDETNTPTTTNTDSLNGYGIAAVGGAEYYFSPRFALGVEAELGLFSEETAVDVRETVISTSSFVTAKVFFK